MANPTITDAVGDIFTFATGEVDSVKSRIAADIDQVSIPGFGPSQAFLFDFNGVNKVISLRGEIFDDGVDRITGTATAITILAQKQWLEQNLNGLQQAVNFTSTYETQTHDGTSYEQTKVMWGTIEFDEISGDPEVLKFNAMLIVGS